MINLVNQLIAVQSATAGASGGHASNSPVVSFLNNITQTITQVGANVLT